MAREFAGNFYKTAAWVSVRNAYIQKAGGLCERCLEMGMIRPGEIVHHKIKLTEENIKDPAVALNMDNLQLLCRDCHTEKHTERKRRYRIDELGRVIV